MSAPCSHPTVPPGPLPVFALGLAAISALGPIRAESLTGRPGSLVSSFAPTFSAEAALYQAPLTADGGMLLTGEFETIDGELRPGIARLGPDGSLDPEFRTALGLGSNPLLQRIFPLANGRTLVTAQAGTRISQGFRITPPQVAVVLQPDGRVAPSPYLEDRPDTTTIEPLVEHGNRVFLRTTDSITQANALVLLDSTTLRERPLPATSTWPAVPLDIVPVSDGYWILGGINRNMFRLLFRTRLDGTLDPDFPPQSFPNTSNPPFSESYYSLLPAPGDGFLLAEERIANVIIIGGSQVSRQVTVHTHGAAGQRLSSLALSPGPVSPIFIHREADDTTLAPSSDGKSLVRYDRDGTLEPGFAVPLPRVLPAATPTYSPLSPARIRPLATLPDGRFTLGGAQRYLPSGTPDPSWQHPQLRRAGTVTKVAAAGGSSFYAGGEFSALNGTPVSNLVRLTGSGELDPSFQPPFRGGGLTLLDLFPDGSLLVTSGDESTELLRLRPNGSRDETFLSSLPAGAIVLDGAVDDQGRALVLFSPRITSSIFSLDSLYRLHPDGSRDQSFSHNNRPPGIWFDAGSTRGPVAVLGDGTYMAYKSRNDDSGALLETLPGSFASRHTGDWFLVAEDNSRAGRVPLLHRWHLTDGPDRSFNAAFRSFAGFSDGEPIPRGSFLSLVHGLREGRILTAGQLATPRGDYRALRLHSDGSPDFAFAPPNPYHLLPDVPGLELLIADGALAPATLDHRRLQADLLTALELPNGSIVVGGDFTHLGSERRSGLAALCGGTASTFERWCETTFARAELPVHLSGPDDDPDDDGASNFYEFASGSDPLVADPDAFGGHFSGSNPVHWILPRNPDAAGIELLVEVTSDLQHWRLATRNELTIEEVGTKYRIALHLTETRVFLRARFTKL